MPTSADRFLGMFFFLWFCITTRHLMNHKDHNLLWWQMFFKSTAGAQDTNEHHGESCRSNLVGNWADINGVEQWPEMKSFTMAAEAIPILLRCILQRLTSKTVLPARSEKSDHSSKTSSKASTKASSIAPSDEEAPADEEAPRE
jgi:hypothetical protein